MEILLAALALLLVQLLPFTVFRRQVQASGDLLHPLRLVSILGIVSTIPFLLAVAMDPETISRPTRTHPDLPDLTGGILWYCLLQGLGFLCLLAGYLTPKRLDRFRLPDLSRTASSKAVWSLAAIALLIGFGSYAYILVQVGGLGVLMAKMQQRSELLAGNNYAVFGLNLVSVGVCAALLTNRFGVTRSRIAIALALFALAFVMFGTLGGRLSSIRLTLLLLLTWHYGVRRFVRMPRALTFGVLGIMVPFFLVMPLFRNPQGAALYIENPNRLLPDLQKQFTNIAKQTSYVETYVLVTNHFNASNVWLGGSYADLLYGPIPSSMLDGHKPPLDDGVYVRTLYDGDLRVHPGMDPGDLDKSSMPPETLGAMYMNFWIPGVVVGMFLLGACYRYVYEAMMRNGRSLYTILLYGQALVMLQFSNLRIVQCLTTFVVLTGVFWLVERKSPSLQAVRGMAPSGA